MDNVFKLTVIYLFLLCSWFVVDKAQAVTYSTMESAYAAAAAQASLVNASGVYVQKTVYSPPTTFYGLYHYKNGWNGVTWDGGGGTWTSTNSCGTGIVWNDTAKTCNPIAVCTGNQIYKVDTNTCYQPKECAYPESDNGNNICANNQCPVGQNRNPVSNVCQVSPVCGATESINSVTNLCELNKLSCPKNTHANTANDACLANAPLVCPSGQHDDGSYQCVSNDPQKCKSNQVAGFINGIPQCISQTNVFDKYANNTAKDLTAAAAVVAKNAAQVTADNAAAALAADPTNQTKINADTAAKSGLQVAVSGNNTAKDAANVAKDDLQNAALKSIAESTKEMNDRGKADALAGFGSAPASDTTGTKIITASVSSSVGSGSCPAPVSMALSFKTINFSFDYLCEFAGMISGLIVALAWLAAARIIFGGNLE